MGWCRSVSYLSTPSSSLERCGKCADCFLSLMTTVDVKHAVFGKNELSTMATLSHETGGTVNDTSTEEDWNWEDICLVGCGLSSTLLVPTLVKLLSLGLARVLLPFFPLIFFSYFSLFLGNTWLT